MIPEELRKLRFDILQKHYELSSGDVNKEVSRDELAKLLNFNDYNDDKLLAQISYLNSAGYLSPVSNMGDSMTIRGVVEVEKGFPHLNPQAQSNSKQSSMWLPNDLEDKIIRTIYEEDKLRRRKRHTAREIVTITSRNNPGLDQSKIEQALTILIAKKYFDKQTVRSPGFSYSLPGTKSKSSSVTTTYYSLSANAYLYLEGRLGNKSDEDVVLAVYDSSSPYSIRRLFEELFKKANSQIRIIDNYIGRKTLDYILFAQDKGVPVKILTSNYKEKDFDDALKDFKAEYQSSIEIKQKPGVFHGRVVIIDDQCYIVDHSIKDFGQKPSSINPVDEPRVNEFYIKLFEDNWN